MTPAHIASSILADADATMIPGGWVISLVGVIITAGLAGLAGWKIRDRTVETKLVGQPIDVRLAASFASVQDIKKMTTRVKIVEERIERLVCDLRAEEEVRTVRLHERIDKQDRTLGEILRAVGRLEGRGS